jgi:hypothetical protein
VVVVVVVAEHVAVASAAEASLVTKKRKGEEAHNVERRRCCCCSSPEFDELDGPTSSSSPEEVDEQEFLAEDCSHSLADSALASHDEVSCSGFNATLLLYHIFKN